MMRQLIGIMVILLSVFIGGCFENESKLSSPSVEMDASCDSVSKSTTISTSWDSGVWPAQKHQITLSCFKSEGQLKRSIDSIEAVVNSFCIALKNDLTPQPAPGSFFARPELRQTPDKKAIRGVWIEYGAEKSFYPCEDAKALLETFRNAKKRCCTSDLESKQK